MAMALQATLWNKFPQGPQLHLQPCKDASGKPVDHIINKGDSKVITGDEAVLFETMAITQFVEYQYEDQLWRVSNISMSTLETFRAGKYEGWKKNLLTEECEAAIKRMLAIKVVTNVYDTNMFPHSAADKAKYTVKNDKGKEITLPHPVAKFRLWNPQTAGYDDVSPALVGAPTTQAAKDAEWAKIVAELKKRYGDQQVEDWLASTGASGGTQRGPCDLCAIQ